MARITVRAADSATALDEVLNRLGPDALILSTRRSRGEVEVIAAPAPSPPARPDLARLDLVRPDPAVARRPEPEAARLEPAQTSAAAGRADFSGLLQRRIAAPARASSVQAPHLPGRIVLSGPPGAGRSMLAARLAAQALRTKGAARPVLIAPRPDPLTPPGPLQGWARLMGLVPHRPVWPGGVPVDPEPPHPGAVQIVDLSDLPDLSPAALAPLASPPGAQVWLVLPTGLHPSYLDAICARHAGLAAHVVLTRTDLFPPTAEDLVLPGRHGLAVSLLAGGPGLLDALRPNTPTTPREEMSDDPARLS